VKEGFKSRDDPILESLGTLRSPVQGFASFSLQNLLAIVK
jgi:hypothetical protein